MEILKFNPLDLKFRWVLNRLSLETLIKLLKGLDLMNFNLGKMTKKVIYLKYF